jgi:hypothetical protein
MARGGEMLGTIICRRGRWSAESDSLTYFEIQLDRAPAIKCEYVGTEILPGLKIKFSENGLRLLLKRLLFDDLTASKRRSAKDKLPRAKWYATATERELDEVADYLAGKVYEVITHSLPTLVMGEVGRLLDETILAESFLPRESLQDRRHRLPNTQGVGSPLRALTGEGVIDEKYLDENPKLLLNHFVYDALIYRAKTAGEIDRIHKRLAEVQKNEKLFGKVGTRRKDESKIELELEAVRLKFRHKIAVLEPNREYDLWRKAIQERIKRLKQHGTDEARQKYKEKTASLLKNKRPPEKQKELTQGQIAMKLKAKFKDESITGKEVDSLVSRFRDRYVEFRKAGPTDLNHFYMLRAPDLKARFGIDYNVEDGKLIEVLEKEWVKPSMRARQRAKRERQSHA